MHFSCVSSRVRLFDREQIAIACYIESKCGVCFVQDSAGLQDKLPVAVACGQDVYLGGGCSRMPFFDSKQVPVRCKCEIESSVCFVKRCPSLQRELLVVARSGQYMHFRRIRPCGTSLDHDNVAILCHA